MVVLILGLSLGASRLKHVELERLAVFAIELVGPVLGQSLLLRTLQMSDHAELLAPGLWVPDFWRTGWLHFNSKVYYI